jgi:hypothetical protein
MGAEIGITSVDSSFRIEVKRSNITPIIADKNFISSNELTKLTNEHRFQEDCIKTL